MGAGAGGPDVAYRMRVHLAKKTICYKSFSANVVASLHVVQ